MYKKINEILANVDSVPKCGNPGTLICIESNSFPILTGEDTSSVIFAAAEYGRGRVFVVSHQLFIENFLSYSNNFGVIWNNIKKWLLHGESIEDEEIENIEKYDSIVEISSNVKLIKWIGFHSKTELFISQFLKKFVSNGGAVICGISPLGLLVILCQL
jgi:hypothetical protein